MAPTSDPHGSGLPRLVYGPNDAALADDVTGHQVNDIELRFGVVSAVTNITTHNTSTVTINGIDMPHLLPYSPQVGDWVSWLDTAGSRICIGEYGTDLPRIKTYMSTAVNVAPNTFATPGDIWFDGNATTEYQRSFDHSHSTFPYLHGVVKTGLYDVGARMELGAGDGSVRALVLKLNGTAIAADYNYAPSTLFPSTMEINVPLELNSGDTLGIAYVHNASGTLSLNAGRGNTFFSATRRAANA